MNPIAEVFTGAGFAIATAGAIAGTESGCSGRYTTGSSYLTNGFAVGVAKFSIPETFFAARCCGE